MRRFAPRLSETVRMPAKSGVQICAFSAPVRRTYTGLRRYNTGMQMNQRSKIAKTKIDLAETWNILGGFLIALLLSRVQIHGMHMPCALGLLLGCALCGIDSYAVIGGVVLGAIIDSPPQWQTVLAAILFAAALRVAERMKRKCTPRIVLILYAAAFASSLPIVAIYDAIELLYGAITLLLSAAFGICVSRMIRSAKQLRMQQYLTNEEQTVYALVIGAVLLALSELQWLGWSASVSLLLVLTGTAVAVRGVYGAAAGTFWASLLILYTSDDPLLIGVVALGALTGSMLRRYGKPPIAASLFVSATLFRTVLSDACISANLQNLFSGMLVFLLIPRAWTERLKALTDADARSEQTMRNAIERIEYGASNELMRMGKLLSGFSGMFRTALQEEDAVRRWTVQGALTVCGVCQSKDVCWKDAQEMQEAILRTAEDAASGRKTHEDGPIDPDCPHRKELDAAVQLAYQQAQNRNVVCERVREQTGLVDRQFAGAGEALCVYAERMRGRDREEDLLCERIRTAMKEHGAGVISVDRYASNGDETLSVCVKRPLKWKRAELLETLERACGFRLRIVESEIERDTVTMLFERDAALHASMQVSRLFEGQNVSGDATGECRLLGGHVCFALSDGMGTGKSAREESEAAIDLLFRLCHAGMQKELIYENVNRLLLARNDTEMYATLDAVSIDLNTGEAELLKYGAPPSFLVRNGTVRPIFGEALPCGILAEAKPSVIRLKLRRDDRLVLCSDGVQDVLPFGAEQAIRTVAGSEDALGDRLLKLAQKSGGADDMTVLVIRVA